MSDENELRSKLEDLGLYEVGMTVTKMRELNNVIIASTQDYHNIQAKSEFNEPEPNHEIDAAKSIKKFEERQTSLDTFKKNYLRLQDGLQEADENDTVNNQLLINKNVPLCDTVELITNQLRSQRRLHRAQQSYQLEKLECKKVYSDSLRGETKTNSDSYTRSGRSIRKPVYYYGSNANEDDAKDVDFKPTKKIDKNSTTNGPKKNEPENDSPQKLTISTSSSIENYELEIAGEEPRISNKRKQVDCYEPSPKSPCYNRSPILGRSATPKNSAFKSKSELVFDTLGTPSTSKRKYKATHSNTNGEDRNRDEETLENQVTCPICNNQFDSSVVEDHASSCNLP